MTMQHAHLVNIQEGVILVVAAREPAQTEQGAVRAGLSPSSNPHHTLEHSVNIIRKI